MKIQLPVGRFANVTPVCALSLMTVMLLACDNRQNAQQSQEIRQQTADATRDVQKGAKELAAGTKVAAANAVDGVNAMAQGVKDGVNSSKAGDSGDLVDINSASTARLALLPGISLTKAHDIVEGRPYDSAHALVRRKLLTQAQYDRIAGKIEAK